MESNNRRVNYADSSLSPREDFAESHSAFWTRLARPGNWWTGAQRIAIAREARAAWDCSFCSACRAALSPISVDGAHQRVSDLPDAAVEAVHRIATDASRLTKSWYEGLLAQGLSDGQYVELVGTVVSIVSIDSFAQALGLDERALPEPVAGEPTRYRPAAAAADDAWVAMIGEDNSATPEADLWVAGQTGNVVRAMSLVPAEVRTLKQLSAAHYLAMSEVRNTDQDSGRALDRSQIELLAGRTSSLNACFY